MATNKSRRDFIRLSTAAATGISLTSLGGTTPPAASLINNQGKLSEGSKRLMQQFNLKYPIFQAAPGGEELAAAMSSIGCMAAMQLTWRTAEDCRRIVKQLLSANVNYYGNFVLHFPPANLAVALEAGLKLVQFSFGLPDAETVRQIRSFNAKFGVQVASKQGAESALVNSPDFIICQGIEAGGHVQANDSIQQTLSEVVRAAGQVPVLAAGGIATGSDIRQMLSAGAAGVVMGTRLIATIESDIHQTYKESLVEAKENSTVFTNCFDRGWPAMHRVLKNKTFNDWEAAGCPLPGKRPGENDIIGKSGSGGPIERYSPSGPGRATTGQLKEMVMYAGTGVKDVNDLPSVKDLIPRLWKEFEG